METEGRKKDSIDESWERTKKMYPNSYDCEFNMVRQFGGLENLEKFMVQNGLYVGEGGIIRKRALK